MTTASDHLDDLGMWCVLLVFGLPFCGPISAFGNSWGAIFSIADLYPGLNDAERKLAQEASTAEMLNAYSLSIRAQNICRKYYLNSRTNDESDACRHYIWAGLLLNKFEGQKVIDFYKKNNFYYCSKASLLESETLTSKILNAHESDRSNPLNEKKMDMYNNREGLCDAEVLIDSGKFSEDALLAKFADKIKSHRLVILKPNMENRNMPQGYVPRAVAIGALLKPSREPQKDNEDPEGSPQ